MTDLTDAMYVTCVVDLNMESRSTKLGVTKRESVRSTKGTTFLQMYSALKDRTSRARWLIARFERTSGEHSKDYVQKFSVRMKNLKMCTNSNTWGQSSSPMLKSAPMWKRELI